MGEGKCTVRDGNFVEACESLLEHTDNITPGFSKAKGIARWSYTNLKTRQRVSDEMATLCDALEKSPDGNLNWRAPFYRERFVIPKPVDPRITAMRKMLAARGITDPRDDVLADDFARLEAELNALGFVVREWRP